MVVLPLSEMVPPVEQRGVPAAHRAPASGAQGVSATCWVPSHSIPILHPSFIHMHDAFVFTYICCGYGRVYLPAGVQLFHTRVLG